jgi:1-acyl-sn-glycerol-3-phosphate acyltransferase
MLAAIPNPLFLIWFDGWCRRALRQAFHQVHLYLDRELPFDPKQSHLYVANHSSFWDGIVLYHWLRTRRRQPIYCMIDEVQVREHPFFRRVGGFSVDRANPRDGLRAIDYASELLNHDRIGTRVIVFPQGELRHNDLRPLGFESGVARIIEKCPAVKVITVALRYEFWKEQRAEAMVSADEFDDRNQPRDALIRSLEETISQQLDRLQQRAREFQTGEILLQGRASISKWKRVIGGGKV